MKIKKKLQNNLKKIFQKLFILMYGKIIFNKSYNFLNEDSSNCLDKVTIDNNNYNCFKIANGKIYTDVVENVAVTSKNNLVKDACFQKVNGELKREIDNICLKKGTPRFKKSKKGNLLSLIQDASENNYSHWLLDILPRLKIFEENNSMEEIDYFLLPELKYSFHYETLKILNIPFDKILSDRKNRHIESEKLFVTDHPWYKKGFIHDEMINMPEWIIVWLRNKFLSEAENDHNNNKIYIDRSDSLFNHCKIINSEQLWNPLKKNGFRKFKLTEINFKSQVGLFNFADIIIGAHGAGLSNIIFSKPSSRVIEIKPKDHVNKFFTRVSKINNLEHKEIISRPLPPDTKNENGDILVDLDEIEKLIG